MRHARDLWKDPAALPEGVAPFEALVIAAFRAWERGDAGAVLPVLRAHMGQERAASAMAALCDLAGLLCVARRRAPGARLPGDARLGTDEAALARFVKQAALGEREDALLRASLLVEAPALMTVTDAAARFGLHVHRAVLSSDAGLTRARQTTRTLH